MAMMMRSTKTGAYVALLKTRKTILRFGGFFISMGEGK